MSLLINPRSVSVIVLCHNDGSRVEATVQRLVRALTVTLEDYEILVIDDGATDHETIAALGRVDQIDNTVKVLRNESRKGLRDGLIDAAKSARMSFMVYVPADNTWPHRAFVDLFTNLGKADIVTSYTTNLRAGMKFWPRLISIGYTKLINILFGLEGHYYNGLTLYPRSFFRSVNLRSKGFGVQAEALIKAIRSGYSFIEVPVPVDSSQLSSYGGVDWRNSFDALSMILAVFAELRLASPRNLRTLPSAPPETAAVEQKYIVITGASTGIGAALVKAFASEGCKVFCCARRLEVLEKVTEDFPTALAFRCDVAEESDVQKFCAWVSAQTPKIDVLINCAGGLGSIGSIVDTDSSAWLQTIKVNLFGNYLMIKHLLPDLEKSKSGRIINFSGGGAFNPVPNYSAYACSKAAVVRLTESLALELKERNISINAVAPGILPTEVHRATVEAGRDKAGRLSYERALEVLKDQSGSVDLVVKFVKRLTHGMDGLTGKTISVNFDPWSTKTFNDYIEDINRSDLYTLRRINVVNLPPGFLRNVLAAGWSGFGARS